MRHRDLDFFFLYLYFYFFLKTCVNCCPSGQEFHKNRGRLGFESRIRRVGPSAPNVKSTTLTSCKVTK